LRRWLELTAIPFFGFELGKKKPESFGGGSRASQLNCSATRSEHNSQNWYKEQRFIAHFPMTPSRKRLRRGLRQILSARLLQSLWIYVISVITDLSVARGAVENSVAFNGRAASG